MENKNVKLAKIEYETRPKQLCKLYEDLIGRMRPNPNIKYKKYWKMIHYIRCIKNGANIQK
jgi:hypothetical protein